MNFTKIHASSNATYDAGLRAYMLAIYNYMFVALVITGLSAVLAVASPLSYLVFNIQDGQFYGLSGLGTLIAIAPVGIAFYLFWGINKVNTRKAMMLFWVYAALTGVSLSSVCFVYTMQSIARSFFITAAVFGAMSIYGYSTKRDLTSFGSFVTMGLLGVIIASLMNIFLKSSGLNFAISLLSVGIFTGLIAFDTQKLKEVYLQNRHNPSLQKVAILGAFTLYLDLINLFIYILRFVGNRRD
ncbi:Bax inhibitor-1/YccA family protein [Rickettsiales endosymbiont of Paramecium tredecaurelia]|uniref:Bax inhibitor-1/YccA family protein n=1 Tax=Candidatus Sarmatiella mevalonica TaxID=2770581 RepID=UPI0019220155|nr:Bax inhibitor-1/YccA family protein [Candidatus Sarmatiella mevalonica]MBL3284251.1 Bax inhibitor-1/YccA family protein [Candidatus Sarmatiella mevalonica]